MRDKGAGANSRRPARVEAAPNALDRWGGSRRAAELARNEIPFSRASETSLFAVITVRRSRGGVSHAYMKKNAPRPRKRFLPCLTAEDDKGGTPREGVACGGRLSEISLRGFSRADIDNFVKARYTVHHNGVAVRALPPHGITPVARGSALSSVTETNGMSFVRSTLTRGNSRHRPPFTMSAVAAKTGSLAPPLLFFRAKKAAPGGGVACGGLI